MANIEKLIPEGCVILDADLTNLDQVIEVMTLALANSGLVTSAKTLCQEIMEREKLGSTAFPGGIALPHARSVAAKELVICMLRTKKTVLSPNLYEKNVSLFFMIATPLNEARLHIDVLSTLARKIDNKESLSFLKKADSIEQVREILKI